MFVLKYMCHILQSYALQMSLKNLGQKAFGKRIHKVIPNSNLTDNHISFTNNLFQEMIFSLNVFTLLMTHWLFSMYHYLTVIITQCQGLYRCVHHFNVRQEFLEPYFLFSNFTICTYSASIVELVILYCIILLSNQWPHHQHKQ